MSGTALLLDPLTRSGLRVTAPRRAVAGLIATRSGHFTAADLAADARGRQLAIGRATIFRTLDVFVRLGGVERIDLPTGEHAYVRCEPSHHHHVVCSVCGRTDEVDGCDMQAVVHQVAERTGYRVDGHRLELYGICPACRAGAPAGTSAGSGGVTT